MAFCPICRSEAAVLPDKAGNANGFDYLRHGKFKIAETVLAIAREKRANVEQWEAAL